MTKTRQYGEMQSGSSERNGRRKASHGPEQEYEQNSGRRQLAGVLEDEKVYLARVHRKLQ